MNYWFQKTIQLKSRSEGCYLITDEILQSIGSEIKKIQIGLCNIFLLHTSAGLILNENWDSSVQKDMKNFFNRLAPKQYAYQHGSEGPDDMPAHIKCALTSASLTIPIQKGQLYMGTWQGIWLMEYRTQKHTRSIVVTINGQQYSKN